MTLATILLANIVMANDNNGQWPPLDEYKFVSGRPATAADFRAGSAAFLLESKEVSAGSPLQIDLPQYAYHIDVETGTKTAVVIIQAEKLDEKTYIGAEIISTGQQLLGFIAEFEFLGNEVPK